MYKIKDIRTDYDAKSTRRGSENVRTIECTWDSLSPWKNTSPKLCDSNWWQSFGYRISIAIRLDNGVQFSFEFFGVDYHFLIIFPFEFLQIKKGLMVNFGLTIKIIKQNKAARGWASAIRAQKQVLLPRLVQIEICVRRNYVLGQHKFEASKYLDYLGNEVLDGR